MPFGAQRALLSGLSVIDQLRGIGGLKAFIDAQASTASVIPDLSGAPGTSAGHTTNGPIWSASGWSAGKAGFVQTAGNAWGIQSIFSFAALAQPFTVVAVLDGYQRRSAADAVLWRVGASDPTSYIRNAVAQWAMYAGSAVDSTFTEAGNLGKICMMNVFDDTRSLSCIGAVEQAMAPGAGGIAGTLPLNVGSSNGTNFGVGTIGSFLIYGKALDAGQRTLVRRLLASRWPSLLP